MSAKSTKPKSRAVPTVKSKSKATVASKPKLLSTAATPPKVKRDVLAAVDRFLAGQFDKVAHPKRLQAKQMEALASQGIGAKVGVIQFAGRVKDGTYGVQFNADGNGWSSRWPEWAYEVAREALLHNKRVWVIYEGDMPFGPNLLQVLIFPYSV